jgi:hypothetical protein
MSLEPKREKKIVIAMRRSLTPVARAIETSVRAWANRGARLGRFLREPGLARPLPEDRRGDDRADPDDHERGSV